MTYLLNTLVKEAALLIAYSKGCGPAFFHRRIIGQDSDSFHKGAFPLTKLLQSLFLALALLFQTQPSLAGNNTSKGSAEVTPEAQFGQTLWQIENNLQRLQQQIDQGSATNQAIQALKQQRLTAIDTALADTVPVDADSTHSVNRKLSLGHRS
ncbi:MAG: hypothetical protein ACU84J_07915 [Gammaproteobacteria bacterium]